MNIMRKIMGYAPGLAFLGTVKLRVFCGLAQILIHVSTVKINILCRNRVRWNQLVITVSEINRFYMQCKDLLLQHGMNLLFFTIKL